nr:major facilitator superfamily domain-containing protein 6-like [Procambarus clarkii]
MADVKEKSAAAKKSVDGCVGWWTRLRGYLTFNRELVAIKIILFLFYCGQSAYLPYLTLHMQVLGLTVKEIAIVYSFLPIASLLGPLTSGLAADALGKYKSVMVVNTVLTIVLHVSLLYVPARPVPNLALTCGPDHHTLTWAACDLCHQDRNHTQLELTLKDCRFHCEAPPPEEEEEEELQVCLGVDHLTHCLPLNTTNQMQLNGTVLSWREDDRCSHRWYDLVYEGQVFHTLTCPSRCQVECQVEGLLSCGHPDDPTNNPHTFWIYFWLRMAAMFFMASAFSMSDATTLALLEQHGGDLGVQRLYGVVGLSLGPLFSGILIDKFSPDPGSPDYSPGFYIGGILVLLSNILVSRLNFTVKTAGENVMKNLFKLLCRIEIDVFLLMVLAQGASWGFIESFLFVFLKELGAPTYLLGLTITVGSLGGAPLLLVLDRVIDRMGRPIVFIFSFFTYAVRHFGYSFIKDPWLSMPFELLEVVTNQLMWLAVLTFCPILAPRGLLATMTGITGSIHYSLGRGVGSLLGGFLISQYGTVNTFRIFGGISLGCGALYALVHFTFLKNKIAEREASYKEQKELEEEEEAMLDKVYNTTVKPISDIHTEADTSC